MEKNQHDANCSPQMPDSLQSTVENPDWPVIAAAVVGEFPQRK